MDLPTFVYHPDPIATGSIIPSTVTCLACGQERGYIYTGPVYAIDDLDDALCPWCIADGTAHARFDATFTGEEVIGGAGNGYTVWELVPDKVIAAVAERTPGFASWQGGRWFTHCGDAAALIAIAGHDELAALGPEAVAAIREDCGYEGDEWEDYFAALDRDYGPTAYIFRCLHCGQLGGYSDIH